jgi:hypothetical protein
MLLQTTAFIRLHVMRIVIKSTQEKKTANRSLSIFSSLSITRQRSPSLSPTAWNSLGAFLQTDGITRHLEPPILQFGDIFSAQRSISTSHSFSCIIEPRRVEKESGTCLSASQHFVHSLSLVHCTRQPTHLHRATTFVYVSEAMQFGL